MGSWPQTAARLKASKVGLAPAFWYPLTPAARHLLRVTPETLCMASHRHANLPYARSQAWRPLQHLLSERGLLQRAQRTSNITNASESSATEGVFAFSPRACAMYAHAGLCIAMPFARDCLLTLRGVPLFSGSLKFWPVSPPRSCSLLLPSWPSSSYPPRSCPSWPPPLQRPLLGPPSTDGYRSPGHPPRDNLVLSFMFVCASISPVPLRATAFATLRATASCVHRCSVRACVSGVCRCWASCPPLMVAWISVK